MALCNGKSRRTGKPCQKSRVAGREYCEFHGGQLPVGAAAPGFKHGRHSKFAIIPGELRERMELALSDPERLELREHIDLLNSKLSDIMAAAAAASEASGKIGPDGSPQGSPPWQLLALAWEAFRTADAGSRTQANAMARLDAIINGGVKMDQSWAQAVEVMEQIRRMVETQTRRDEKLGQFIPAERVLATFHQVAASIQRNVSNPEEKRAIQRDLTRLLVATPGTRPQLLDVDPEIQARAQAASTPARLPAAAPRLVKHA